MKSKLVTCLVAILFALATVEVACGGKSISNAIANSGDPSGAGSGASTGTKSVTINDPVLNMQAFTFTIPASWNFEGAVVPGASCTLNGAPNPVFRMSSPDGLTGIKGLPPLNWAWSENPQFARKPRPDCLPYNKEISAADFTAYMVGILKVEFVKDVSTPDTLAVKTNASKMDTPQMKNTADAQISFVRYHVNNLVINEKLFVHIGCIAYDVGLGRQHNCAASVERRWAPASSQWPVNTFKVVAMDTNQQWWDRWTAVMVKGIRDMGTASRERNSQMMDDAARQRNAQYNAFNQAQALRQQEHEDFMASMQRGTNLSMQRTAEASNARQHAAGDWADYALDRQKRLDPNTGLITKDSSAYSYTWVNESGQRIQTNDVNANPNGNGTGNWTLQENVR